MADFVEVTANGSKYQSWWNKIKSKHVDFLVWNRKDRSITLAIEVDDKSHGTDRVQNRDMFINEVYKKVGNNIVRIKVGDNFFVKIQQIQELYR